MVYLFKKDDNKDARKERLLFYYFPWRINSVVFKISTINKSTANYSRNCYEIEFDSEQFNISSFEHAST